MSRPTQEEIHLARELALLEILIDIVTNNREDIKLANYTLKTLFVATTDAVIDDITNDVRKLKLSLKQTDVKLSKEATTGTELQYVLHCRGYVENFSILRHTVKPELGVLLGRYVKKIEGLLRNL